jgi:sigma-B regulation protein RsbU (phosphoserine phosphatase)
MSHQEEFKTELLNAKIMIVDDNNINVRVVQAHLQKAGFKNFETACDGVDALSKIDAFAPDLLVLDLLMPNMDGFEVIQNLRARPEYEQLPIIVQTALTNPEEQNGAWNSGTNDIVTKPIHPLELVSRVFVHLKQSYLLKELTAYQIAAQDDIAESLILQQSLLPEKNHLSKITSERHINCDFIYIACRFLSGDLWGCLPIDEHKFAIWIADFTGKGIRASLNTFRLHAHIQKLNVDYNNPSDVLFELNQRLTGVLKRGTFATFLYGIWDSQNNKFSYASAGSTNPILYDRKQKKMEMLMADGVPLGIDKNITYDTITTDFNEDSSLLFYSDFMWESRDIIGVSFEEEHLVETSHMLNGDLCVPFIQKIIETKGKNLNLTDDFTLIEISSLNAVKEK